MEVNLQQYKSLGRSCCVFTDMRKDVKMKKKIVLAWNSPIARYTFSGGHAVGVMISCLIIYTYKNYAANLSHKTSLVKDFDVSIKTPCKIHLLTALKNKLPDAGKNPEVEK